MLKKFLIFALVVSCSSAIFAQDYATEWKAAYKLYRAKKYAEVIPIFVKLAENTSNPSNKFNCYIHAGYSARNMKKYDEAIAFAKQASEVRNPYKYSGMVRELDFMYSAKKYQEMIDKFSLDEIKTWPKYYIPDALNYLGLAQYQLKKGEDAEATFQLMQENAETAKHKAIALMRSGHNYRDRLKDNAKAEAAYTKAIDVPNSQPHYIAEACEGLATLYMKQKKNDEAIAQYNKALTGKLNAYWKSRILYRKADLLKKMAMKEGAIRCYKQILTIKSAASWAVSGSKKNLKVLEAE